MSNTVAKRIIILFIKSIDKYTDITPTSANLLPLFLSSQPQLCVQRLPFPPLFISPWSATPTVVQGGHHLNRCRARRQLTPFMPYKLVTQSIYAIQILAHKYRHLVWCLWFKWTECSRNFRLAKPVSDVSMTNIKMIHINIGSYLQFLFTVLF